MLEGLLLDIRSHAVAPTSDAFPNMLRDSEERFLVSVEEIHPHVCDSML